MSSPSGNGHRIVVGVDGSQAAREALAWALRQAELTAGSIDAVIAWHRPVAIGGMPYGPLAVLEEEDFARFAETTLTNSIRAVIGAGSAVSIRPVIRQGNAAQVLLDTSDGADLLVVGSRGHGGFAEALLGSVSQHCVHHAPCPVMIIRGRRRT
jgi:nucleotide-binding universal stress UspA family protein